MVKSESNQESISSENWTSLTEILLDSLNHEEAPAKKTAMDQATDDENAIALLIFTSGTSSLPKACPHTSKGLWTSTYITNEFRQLSASDTLVQHLPTCHIFAVSSVLVYWRAGATVVLPDNTFSAATTLESIESEQAKNIIVVPTMLLTLRSHPTFSKDKVRSLEQIDLGGSVVSPELLKNASEILGVKASVGFVKKLFFDHGYAGVGRSAPGLNIKICDPETRETLVRGEAGELHLRGDQVTKEYLFGNNDAFYLDENGNYWLATGDQAGMDDIGVIFVLGRYKDIIIRGGESLSPALIDASLNKVLGVVVAQVVGIPDDVADEMPLAAIKFYDDASDLPIKRIRNVVLQELGPANYLKGQDVTQGHENDDGGEMTCDILSYAPGQPAAAIPRDRPIHEFTDSINVLRLIALVKKKTYKDLATEDVLDAKDVKDLAQLLRSAHMVSPADVTTPTKLRAGPPIMAEMIHTYEEEARATKTRSMCEPILRSMDMTWERDVEDVYPVSGVAMKRLAGTRAFTSTVCVAMVSRTASIDQLDWAIKTSLDQWSIFRAICVPFDEALKLFVIIRSGSRWFDLAIIRHADVESPEDLASIDPPKEQSRVRAPGPLIRIIIAKVRKTGTAGCMVVTNHAIQDAISMEAWHEDLEQLLAGKIYQVQARTPHKLFGDIYHAHRTSLQAQLGVNYHLQHLSGIGKLKEALWPPQRCPGWFIGDDSEWQPSALEHGIGNGNTTRTQLDEEGWRIGFDGITEFTHLAHLEDLWAQHRISAPVLFKTACALLNAHITGQLNILFANSQAGRQWPFLEESITRYLPNPLTFAVVINKIYINTHEETVGVLITQLEKEQQQLTKHTHAPILSVLQTLSQDDASTAMEATRQLFNWQPFFRGQEARAARAELKAIQIEGHTDRGVILHCGMIVAETARLTAQWDGAQVCREDMEGWVVLFLRVLVWLQVPGHWERSVEEFGW